MDLAALLRDLRPPDASACRRCAASPRRYSPRARNGGRWRRPSRRPRRSRRRPCPRHGCSPSRPICRRDGAAQGRLSHATVRGAAQRRRNGPARRRISAVVRPFAVRTPARRGEQIHPDLAQRARRAQILQKADPGLEVDDGRIVRRGTARSGRSRSARRRARRYRCRTAGRTRSARRHNWRRDIRIARVMDAVARRRVEHVFQPAQPGDPVGMQPELIEQVQEQGRQHEAGVKPSKTSGVKNSDVPVNLPNQPSR